MSRGTDNALRILSGLTVAALAIVAGAISFAHMRELALDHDQLGWKSYAFPVSVDGLEIVASLYLVAQRRAGRRTGWLPWVALLVGTLASLAANIAVGGNDLVGKALAGWPALSMLVAVKLLFSMIDDRGVDRWTEARNDQRASVDRPLVPQTVQATVRDAEEPSRTAPAQLTTGSATSVDLRDFAHLLPAARRARAALLNNGRSMSRDNLADRMRYDGYGVSNARAGALVKLLRAEADTTTLDRTAVRIRDR